MQFFIVDLPILAADKFTVFLEGNSGHKVGEAVRGEGVGSGGPEDGEEQNGKTANPNKNYLSTQKLHIRLHRSLLNLSYPARAEKSPRQHEENVHSIHRFTWKGVLILLTLSILFSSDKKKTNEFMFCDNLDMIDTLDITYCLHLYTQSAQLVRQEIPSHQDPFS